MTPRRVLGVLLLGASCGGALPAAALRGVVLEAASGRPLARSEVTLLRFGDGREFPINRALSDSSGRFSFQGLGGGTFFVSAARNGFAPAYFGQRRANGAGAPIVLSEDGEFFADVRLKRLGAVSGHIWDENEVGLPGTTVYAYQAGRIAGSASSDDRGAYRIAGLPPGEYRIRTGPRELEDHRSLLPTFHGHSPQGQLVEVALDSEAERIDIQPQAGRLARLSGQVSGGAAAWVELASQFGSRRVVPSAGGAFLFEQLAPGEYELRAAGASAPPTVAYRKLTIGAEAAGVTLELAPPPIVRVGLEEEGGPRLATQRISVLLKQKGITPETPFLSPPPRIPAGSESPVPPGDWAITVQPPADAYVKTLRPGPELSAAPGQTVDVVIGIAARPATLGGKVLASDSAPVPSIPVFLDAADPELRSRLGGMRSTRTGPDGEYRFTGLPPGRYRVFSSFDFQEPQEPDWRALPFQTIDLEEGTAGNLDLEPLQAR